LNAPPPAAQPEVSRSILIRDLIIFQLKLWADGVKDVVLSPISLGAAVLDVLLGPGTKGYRLYRVMRSGERFDLSINLYGAADDAERNRRGLFGAPRSPAAGEHRPPRP
jgi:hypothetical protein